MKIEKRNIERVYDYFISNFYDLFGGGASVSLNALKNYKFKIHYNELNSHVFSLIQYLKNNRNFDEKFYKWIDRETFFEQVNIIQILKKSTHLNIKVHYLQPTTEKKLLKNFFGTEKAK